MADKVNKRRMGNDGPADVEEPAEDMPPALDFGGSPDMNQSVTDLATDQESGVEDFNSFALPEIDEDFDLDLGDPGVTGLLPEGTYPAYLSDVIKGESQKGDPMWTWYFTPLTNFSTNTLRLFTVLTPTAAWKVIETLVALGLGKMGEKAKFKKDDAIYRMCLLEITHEEYPKKSGTIRANINRVLPHPDGVGRKFKPFTGVPDFNPDDAPR